MIWASVISQRTLWRVHWPTAGARSWFSKCLTAEKLPVSLWNQTQFITQIQRCSSLVSQNLLCCGRSSITWKALSWTVAVIRVHSTEYATDSCSADTSPSFWGPPRPDPAAHLWLTMRLSSHFGSAVALSWELSTCPEGYKQGSSSVTNIKIGKKSYLSFSVIFGPPGFLLKASWKPSGSIHLNGSSEASPEIDSWAASVLGASVPPPSCLPHNLCPNLRRGTAECGGSPGLWGHQ